LSIAMICMPIIKNSVSYPFILILNRRKGLIF
jgi:hypothetical protein